MLVFNNENNLYKSSQSLSRIIRTQYLESDELFCVNNFKKSRLLNTHYGTDTVF